jgi:hypothetical protein
LLNIQDEKIKDKDGKEVRNKEYLKVKAQDEWDLYDLTKFLNRVNLKYGKDSEKHHVLMKLTDALF